MSYLSELDYWADSEIEGAKKTFIQLKQFVESQGIIINQIPNEPCSIIRFMPDKQFVIRLDFSPYKERLVKLAHEYGHWLHIEQIGSYELWCDGYTKFTRSYEAIAWVNAEKVLKGMSLIYDEKLDSKTFNKIYKQAYSSYKIKKRSKK